MNPIDPYNRVKALYHFTDTRNLDSIRQLDGLYSRFILKDIDTRIFTGGNQWSLDADEISGMDKYVHLCFLPQHPMEYLAKKDGRIKESIFLEIDRNILKEDDVRFSVEVSNKSGATLYDYEEAQDKIDFNILFDYIPWDTAELKARRKNAVKSEVLVPKHLPIVYIRNLP